MLIVYHQQIVHNVELVVNNTKHRYYKRGPETKPFLEEIISDVENLVPEELKEKARPLIQDWRTRTSEFRVRQRGYDSFCVFPPQPSCVEPYAFFNSIL